MCFIPQNHDNHVALPDNVSYYLRYLYLRSPNSRRKILGLFHRIVHNDSKIPSRFSAKFNQQNFVIVRFRTRLILPSLLGYTFYYILLRKCLIHVHVYLVILFLYLKIRIELFISTDCDISLSEVKLVSGRHCFLEREDDGKVYLHDTRYVNE